MTMAIMADVIPIPRFLRRLDDKMKQPPSGYLGLMRFISQWKESGIHRWLCVTPTVVAGAGYNSQEPVDLGQLALASHGDLDTYQGLVQ